MNARYAEIDVSKPDGRLVRAGFRIENLSADSWRRDQGFAIGYHIFDPDTDTLVVDGARTVLPHDLEPGQPETLALTMELPAEPVIDMYPNPVAAIETLTIKTDRGMTLQLFTLLGQPLSDTIFLNANQSYPYSVANLASGIYIATFTASDKKFYKKFIVH